jgi:hypothetical protein
MPPQPSKTVPQVSPEGHAVAGAQQVPPLQTSVPLHALPGVQHA